MVITAGITILTFLLDEQAIQKDRDYKLSEIKVGCVLPMVISSESCMEQYRDESSDDDHREDAPHFIIFERSIVSDLVLLSSLNDLH